MFYSLSWVLVCEICVFLWECVGSTAWVEVGVRFWTRPKSVNPRALSNSIMFLNQNQNHGVTNLCRSPTWPETEQSPNPTITWQNFCMTGPRLTGKQPEKTRHSHNSCFVIISKQSQYSHSKLDFTSTSTTLFIVIYCQLPIRFCLRNKCFSPQLSVPNEERYSFIKTSHIPTCWLVSHKRDHNSSFKNHSVL